MRERIGKSTAKRRLPTLPPSVATVRVVVDGLADYGDLVSGQLPGCLSGDEGAQKCDEKRSNHLLNREKQKNFLTAHHNRIHFSISAGPLFKKKKEKKTAQGTAQNLQKKRKEIPILTQFIFLKIISFFQKKKSHLMETFTLRLEDVHLKVKALPFVYIYWN